MQQLEVALSAIRNTHRLEIHDNMSGCKKVILPLLSGGFIEYKSVMSVCS
jgi:hypothetical protein